MADDKKPAPKPVEKNKAARAKSPQVVKLDSKSITRILRDHGFFIIFVAVLLILIIVQVRVYLLGAMTPDQAEIDAESAKATLIRYDEDTIKKMKALTPSGINNADETTNTNPDRDNPFGE